MKVFLGSSTESINQMREVATWLEAEGHEPLPWDEPSLFLPGENTFSKLIEISRRVDAAVFIFSEDDKVWYRQDATAQPRDNVLIEYGLYAGALGQKKAIICRKGMPKNASDLHGIVTVDLNTPHKARSSIRAWITSMNPSEPRQEVEPIAPPQENKLGVLIDLSHSQDKWQEGSIFDVVRDKNILINPMIRPNEIPLWDLREIRTARQFRADDLANWKGLLLGIPHHEIIEEGIRNEIVRWVKQGGRLVLMGFELGDRHHETNFNDLAKEFGLRFNSDIIAPKGWDPPNKKPYDVPVELEVVDSTKHSILAGISRLCFENICTLTIEPGACILLNVGDNHISWVKREYARYTDGKMRSGYHDFEIIKNASWVPVMAEAPKGLTGSGKVLAIGTWDLFGRNQEYISGFDNRIFLTNLFNWLIGQD